MSRAFAWVVLAAAAPLAPAAAHAATVYFTDKDAARLYRLEPGSPAQVLLSGANGLVDPRGVALDVAAGRCTGPTTAPAPSAAPTSTAPAPRT
jgi:hypothetical protein